MIYQLETIIGKPNNKISAHYIKCTIMCNGTSAVRICEKKDDEEVFMCMCM